MSDRELLDLAARAAGYPVLSNDDRAPGAYVQISGAVRYWNPLEDDGDAFRLAVKLRLEVIYYCRTADDAEVADCHGQLEATGTDPYAVTRRAIVRAAAALASPQAPGSSK